MLRHLSIRDFILVDSLEIDFHPGMSVLTGETGAGKSILVDALSLVLGDRAEAGAVRQGARKAEIGAEFDVAHLAGVTAWLAECGLECESDQCLLRRVVEAEGRSRAFINGSVVTLAQLRELGEQLVDIHGQHAHHALLKMPVQREMLDEYAGARAQSSATAEAWRTWQLAAQRLRIAREEAGARLLEKEGLQAAIAEAAPLLEDLRHWDELQADHLRQAHMSDLIESCGQVRDGLDNDEAGALRQMHQLRAVLHDMTEKDAALADALAAFDAAISSLQEVRHGLTRYADRLNLDPERLADLDRRMAEALRVSRKHRLAPAELLSRTADWTARLEALDAEQDTAALAMAAEAAEEAYFTQAKKLSAKRNKAALELAESVTRTMSELALSDGRFAIKLSPSEPQSGGMEDVAFLVATHASLSLGPLEKVASGGELSRISLAIQATLSGQAGVPTLIFDEVDVGIGGGVAEMVGRRLAQLATQRQVLVVTHLPQVAACGHQHLRVSKLAGPDRVVSQVTPLDREERVREIARMLGGQAISNASLEHAREMLASASPERPGRGRSQSA